MSRLLKLQGFAMLLSVLIAIAAPVQKLQAQPNVSVSFQMFYNSLQPHGQWIDYPQYGYCWVPNVGRDFRPYYSNGHWAMTEYGNTWVSGYDWGWAPFHYGNWTYDDYYGWIWVPGNTWGPAWVSWRNGGGYYGWAPIAPGVNINVAINNYNCAPHWWVFVPQRHIYARSYNNYWRGPQHNTTIIRNTTIINNTYINNNHRYVSGPRRAEIERNTGQRVRTYGVRSGARPGRSQVRGNTLSVYRPEVNQRSNERPQRVVQASETRATPANRGQRANPRAETPARPQNTERAMPNRNATREPAANNRAARPPQQQQRITERRQQSWQQQRNEPARQDNFRANPPQRSNEARSRPQSTNRSTPHRARPEPRQRAAQPTQRSVQPARPQNQQRASQPARSNGTRSAAPASRGSNNMRGDRGR